MMLRTSNLFKTLLFVTWCKSFFSSLDHLC
uniref:Uncharacterized protein n=1 Tax=Rhizophora mucronata TaxID=61149 RepID=A0A2P2QWL2_RHIMU